MALAALGVHVQVKDHAVDLGLDIGVDRRSRAKAHERGEKVQLRGNRVDRLATHQAKVAVTYGALLPAEAYSAPSCGIAPSELARIRGRLANKAGRPAGACTTTFTAVDSRGDPGKKLRLFQLREWLQLWHRHPELHQGIKECWAILHHARHGHGAEGWMGGPRPHGRPPGHA